MRLLYGLGLLLVAMLAVAGIGPLFAWADHRPGVGVFPWLAMMVGAGAAVAAASAAIGARLVLASIRAAAERQAEAIRRS